MESGSFWIVTLLLIAATIFLFFYIWRSLHRARVIEDTPTAKIRSAHQGYVELEGEGELIATLPITAPLSHYQCLWYRFVVERKETRYSSKGNQTHWRKVHDGSCEEPFLLRDETGDCLVDPEGAEVTPTSKDVWYGHSEWPEPGSAPAGGGTQLLGLGKYRYTEERLMPGPVYALGQFKTFNSTGSVRDRTGELLREWKRDQAALLARFDSNNDGEIDVDEWNRARDAAGKEALREQVSRQAEPPTNMLIKTGDRRQPFLVSAFPQTNLASRYRNRARFSLAGTFVALAVLLWMLSVRWV
ncbi:hypothetical protein BOW53_11910 [Solemya pervernicosa gill symbiont]|uniref:RING-type E3 ubiquitin transferase n=2 Tax=Solemya pervernicosa gill symbiont TaxID=642797 RepID=A0A1T2L2R0_9GAMM|nr:hypothetical protein BOW53_11910 [Solemya pervernicosa gill symbiont]